MKKLLVVSDDAVGAAMVRTGPIIGFDQTIRSSHKDALSTFLSEEPTHVIVFDYSERELGEYSKGAGTYRDLKASATTERILRCGLENYDYPDYVKLPFLLPELAKKLSEPETK
jgi:hypothetical protein